MSRELSIFVAFLISYCSYVQFVQQSKENENIFPCDELLLASGISQ